MLEALGVSNEWVLRGAEPAEVEVAEVVEVAVAEPVVAETAVAAPEPVVARIEVLPEVAHAAEAPNDADRRGPRRE